MRWIWGWRWLLDSEAGDSGCVCFIVCFIVLCVYLVILLTGLCNTEACSQVVEVREFTWSSNTYSDGPGWQELTPKGFTSRKVSLPLSFHAIPYVIDFLKVFFLFETLHLRFSLEFSLVLLCLSCRRIRILYGWWVSVFQWKTCSLTPLVQLVTTRPVSQKTRSNRWKARPN